MNRSKYPLYLLAITVACLIGCATTRPIFMERYALVAAKNGHWGSAIIAGNGYAYLAKHVIINDDSTFSKFIVLFRGMVDSTSYVVASEGDVVLIRTSHGRPLEPILYEDAGYLEEVIWVQPHFREGPPHFYVLVGRVARKDSLSWYVDRPFYPGVSGSGVWNSNGLVGMAHMITGYEVGAFYGVFIPIPQKLIDRTRPIKIPSFEGFGRSP